MPRCTVKSKACNVCTDPGGHSVNMRPPPPAEIDLCMEGASRGPVLRVDSSTANQVICSQERRAVDATRASHLRICACHAWSSCNAYNALSFVVGHLTSMMSHWPDRDRPGRGSNFWAERLGPCATLACFCSPPCLRMCLVEISTPDLHRAV
jgi:hypothetical protein